MEDTYADFAEWREPRPAATVGDAMREFTGTPIDILLAWFSKFKAAGPVPEGDKVTVTLRGTIVSSRTDSDGLKINVSGDGFFVWVTPGASGVTVKRKTSSTPGNSEAKTNAR